MPFVVNNPTWSDTGEQVSDGPADERTLTLNADDAALLMQTLSLAKAQQNSQRPPLRLDDNGDILLPPEVLANVDSTPVEHCECDGDMLLTPQ
jgi:hypothetical protein